MKIKIGLIQMTCVDENDPEPNFTKAMQMVDEAASRGANIVALQEIFNTPYFPNRPRDSKKYFEMAETIPGPTTDRVAAKAKEHGIVIMAPIYEKEMAGVYYNSSALLGPEGELLGLYRKMHIPHSDDFIEKYYFKPGNLGFPVFETPFGNVGMLICYDRHFPEGARALGLEGADILLVPVASPRPTASEVFVKELMGMAIANQYFVAAVNRVGVENGDEFYGTSLVCDPRGNVIAKAGDKEDEVVVSEVDLDQVADTRNNWLFYRDRRPDAYDILID